MAILLLHVHECPNTFLHFSTVPSSVRSVTATRVFQDGVELNWLPPTEPNGEVRYVVEYKREDSGSWTSVNTASDSTHYNLTGLHRGTSYTIREVAVNSAGRSLNEIQVPSTMMNLAGVVAGVVVVACVLILALLIAGSIIALLVLRKRMREKASPQKGKEEGTPYSRARQWEGKQTQQHSREEQHYETTDTAGLDWLGRNVIDVWDEGQGGDDAVDPSKDSVGCVYTDTQTVEQQSSPIKYVVIDHSMNKSQRKEPATEPDDQNVTYATVDKSKKKPKELNGSKTEPGEDVTMGEIYYNLPTHCPQSN